MKNYEVTIYYTTYVTVNVAANNEDEALVDAYLEAGKREYDNQLLNHASESGTPEIYETED